MNDHAASPAPNAEDRRGYFVEDLTPGMTATLSKTVSESDIIQFAEITGDMNPVHLDEDYAAGTMFKGRIAHGMLSAGLISAVLGMRLPGPGCIYLSQSLKFKAPVRLGDTVDATATVKQVLTGKRRVVIDTVCTVAGTVVTQGEALVLVPSRAGG